METLEVITKIRRAACSVALQLVLKHQERTCLVGNPLLPMLLELQLTQLLNPASLAQQMVQLILQHLIQASLVLQHRVHPSVVAHN